MEENEGLTHNIVNVSINQKAPRFEIKSLGNLKYEAPDQIYSQKSIEPEQNSNRKFKDDNIEVKLENDQEYMVFRLHRKQRIRVLPEHNNP